MAYGVKYRFTFESTNKANWRIDILMSDYSGAVIKRNLGGSPILKRENNDNIWGTSLEFPAECQIDGEFSALYTSDATLYKVALYHNDVLREIGFVTPELFTEPDIAPPYDVTITATDNLGDLKNYPFTKLGPHSTIAFIISSILAKTGLDLQIGYCSSMSSGNHSGANLLNSTYVDLDYLIDNDTTAYDALQSILSSLHAVIMQADGRWMIIRENDIIVNADKSSFAYYDLQDESSLAFPIFRFGSAKSNVIWPVNNLDSTVSPASKAVNILANDHYKSMLLNSDMASDTIWEKNGATFNTDHYVLPINAGIVQRATLYGNWPEIFRLSFTARNLPPIKDSVKSQAISLLVKITTSGGVDYYIYKSDNVTTYNYFNRNLYNDKKKDFSKTYPTSRMIGYAYTTTPTFMTYDLNYPENGNTNDCQTFEFDISIPSALRPAISNPISMEVRIYNYGSQYSQAIQACSIVHGSQVSGNRCSVIMDNGARTNDDDVEIAFPYLVSTSKNAQMLMYGIPHLSDYSGLVSFKSSRLAGSQDHLTFISKDYALSKALPRLIKKGKINVPSTFGLIPILFTDGTLTYLIKTYSWELKEDELDVEMISLSDAVISDSVEVKVTDDSGKIITADTNNIILSSSYEDVASTAGSANVEVQTSEIWTAISDSAWAVVSKNGQESFDIDYEANILTNSRQAKIAISNESGRVSVFLLNQKSTSLTLSVSPTSITIDAIPQETEHFAVTTNDTSWTAVSDSSWAVVVDKTDTAFALECDLNNTEADREATITITTASGITTTVRVLQTYLQ